MQKEAENLKSRLTILALITVMVVLACGASQGAAAKKTTLVIDGEKINSSPPPVIKNGRTLVPVRLVSETLGARVKWNQENKTVDITKDNSSIKLRINNRLVDYNTTYGLSDVPPQIFDSRTFVPLRLVSNALGVSVGWDAASKTVYINSNKPADTEPFFDMKIQDINPGQVITESTGLQASFRGSASEIRFLLLDPETGKGPIIARGNSITGIHQWVPDPFYEGSRILAAAVYDSQGNFLAGDVVSVKLNVKPQVTLEGLENHQQITGTASLKPGLNFVASYVKYEITNKDTGNVIVTRKADPQGTYSWAPQYWDNGNTSIRVKAYDRLGQAHYSPPVEVNVSVDKKLALKGVSSGAEIEKPVTLWLSKNFSVSQVEYYLTNPQTSKETTLKRASGYSSFSWFPAPEKAGTWQLAARVKDSAGTTFTTNPITVHVPEKSRLLLNSIGPNQVLSGQVELKSSANVPLNKIEYRLISPGGDKKVIAGGSSPGKKYTWTPGNNDSGNWQIQAVGTTASRVITSESIPVRVYTGKVYSSKPVIEKSKFLDFASELAQESQRKTGMSAALQTAQAILETGWGQHSPVDKYSGKTSYNLFGIKGQGPAGSVTSNTWEEYNGKVYHIDAEFRAYNDPKGSWADHKELLLNAKWYDQYRAVMHNSLNGAWALRRDGYATDSQYPLKLINIIEKQNLHRLDHVGI
ncbi:MAG: glucosaminidase domain-containing protein [Clostridiales bacterium]|nr:glucosaminidase domain-containing protein [Clostridiales bacterium]MCF8023219.1 glucosaminidase domain-containing protein [Clostridiales bacterium]